MSKYSSAKFIVTNGDVEVVYDMPMITNYEFQTNYDDPEFKPLEKKPPRSSKIISISFTVHPLKNDDETFMTMTRTARGVTVIDDLPLATVGMPCHKSSGTFDAGPIKALCGDDGYNLAERWKNVNCPKCLSLK